MAKKTPMAAWGRGPERHRKTSQQSRQDADADADPTPVAGGHLARVSYLIATVAIVACGAGWWWQSGLDGWARGVVLTFTIAVTIYLVVIIGALLLSGWAGRFIRDV